MALNVLEAESSHRPIVSDGQSLALALSCCTSSLSSTPAATRKGIDEINLPYVQLDVLAFDVVGVCSDGVLGWCDGDCGVRSCNVNCYGLCHRGCGRWSGYRLELRESWRNRDYATGRCSGGCRRRGWCNRDCATGRCNGGCTRGGWCNRDCATGWWNGGCMSSHGLRVRNRSCRERNRAWGNIRVVIVLFLPAPTLDEVSVVVFTG